MKKYLYLLVPLTFGVFAGNDEHLSYYVIKDCEIYTATKENPTIPVKKIEANNEEIDNLLWVLSNCPPNTAIRGKTYIPNLKEGDSHFEIVNTYSLNEYLEKMHHTPREEPLIRTHNLCYYAEDISEEVKEWREKVAQSIKISGYKRLFSRGF